MSEIVVFDSSALLAIAKNEAGAEIAAAYLPSIAMCSVNLCEVVTKLLEKGDSLDAIEQDMRGIGLDIIDFNWPLAIAAAELKKKTANAGLSLGDRACLATAHFLRLPVITADRIWATLDIGVDVRLIR